MSIGGIGSGFGNFSGAGMGDSGNMVGKGVDGGQQQGGMDPEALKRLLAQLLGAAGGAGGSQGSSGGGEDDQGSTRDQMSGQGQQGMQMPQENNNSINFG
ncbi:Uncharacterised protein [Pseudomonas fluorescens]|uniref:Uncharacterized protein n=1 Tax=Pseudomonas fluorescens TaxID=294 RepID=A0A379I9K2_PSEFL|nr:hypothetical protein [Pseudomonas fluorescens]SUD29426.1 Uncharacterised protein [Pseudomonas fluorescens]